MAKNSALRPAQRAPAHSTLEMTRVLIVADFPALRAGLAALLAGAADIEIAADAAGAEQALALLAQARPDVVLCDDGEDIAPLLDALEANHAALVLLSEGTALGEVLHRPLRGVAVLTKEAGAAELSGAIRAAHAGLVALDRVFLPQLEARTPATPDLAEERGATLTPREREILQLLAQGLPNKTIAYRMGISQHTVKFHVASLLAKLGAASRTEAVTIGARRGLVLL